MRKLALYTAANAAAFAVYHWANPFSDHTIDRGIARMIVLGGLTAALSSLMWTRRWRTLSLGLLGVFIGIALIYLPQATDGTRAAIRPEPLATATPRWYLEFARSVLVVGINVTIYSLLRWDWRHRYEVMPWFRKEHRLDAPDPFDHGGAA